MTPRMKKKRQARKRKTLPILSERAPIGDVFSPGVVKITCGCSPERAAKCNQRGTVDLGDAKPHQNEHCHVFVDEIDLIELTHDVVKARFANSRGKP